MLMNFTHEKLIDMGMRLGVAYDVFLNQADAVSYGVTLWQNYEDINHLRVVHDSKDNWYEVIYDYPRMRI